MSSRIQYFKQNHFIVDDRAVRIDLLQIRVIFANETSCNESNHHSCKKSRKPILSLIIKIKIELLLWRIFHSSSFKDIFVKPLTKINSVHPKFRLLYYLFENISKSSLHQLNCNFHLKEQEYRGWFMRTIVIIGAYDKYLLVIIAQF